MRGDPPAPARAAVRVRISGRVQGVLFRAWMVERAAALGLDGWVRNRRDGSVEALFVGPPAALAAAVESCREGPPLADVSTVETAAADVEAGVGFGHRPTR